MEAGLTEPELPRGTGLMAALARGPRLTDRDGGPASWLADPGDPRAITAAQALSDLLEPVDEYTCGPASAYQRLAREGSAAPQDHIPSRTRDDTRRRLEAIPPSTTVGGNGGGMNHLQERRSLTSADAFQGRASTAQHTTKPFR